MQLTSPIIITSRLMAGIKIGDGTVSIERDGITSDGRDRFRYAIDAPGVEFEAGDLSSGVGGSSLQEGLESLLSFLGAAASAYAYAMGSDRDSDNADMFPPAVMEWCHQNDDEIACAQMEIQETPDLIAE